MEEERTTAKPAYVNLEGEDGLKAYIEILTAQSDVYDAKKEASKAKRALKKQGVIE